MAGRPDDTPTQQQRDDLLARYQALLGQNLPQGMTQAIQNVATFRGIFVALNQFWRIQRKNPPGQP